MPNWLLSVLRDEDVAPFIQLVYSVALSISMSSLLRYIFPILDTSSQAPILKTPIPENLCYNHESSTKAYIHVNVGVPLSDYYGKSSASLGNFIIPCSWWPMYKINWHNYLRSISESMLESSHGTVLSQQIRPHLTLKEVAHWSLNDYRCRYFVCIIGSLQALADYLSLPVLCLILWPSMETAWWLLFAAYLHVLW